MAHHHNKLLIPVLISLLGMGFITGCEKEEPMKEITQITYAKASGPIVPEMQMYESYTITRETVTLTRTGNVEDTLVNQGTWQVEFEPASATVLFETLAGVDIESIQKVEPEDIPDGGGSEYYTLTYSNGQVFSMEFTPGVTYRNGNLITQLIKELIRQIELPAEARMEILVQ